MPFLNAPIQEDGLIIEVAISMSTMRAEVARQEGISPVSPLWVTALLDTGASCSVIDSTLVRSLKLIQAGVAEGVTPSTGQAPHTFASYDICLAFAKPQVKIMAMNLLVVEATLANQGFLALIGRDVLQHWLLVYNGPTRSFSLSF